MSLQLFNTAVQGLGLDVVDRIRRGSGTTQTLSAGAGEATDVVVARIDPIRAELIRNTLPSQMMLAEDKPLSYGGQSTLFRATPSAAPLSLGVGANNRKIAFKVVGDRDMPLVGVTVQLTGDAFPSQGQTDSDGNVSLDLITLGDRPASALFVAPTPGYWDLYLTHPQLNEESVNLVRLRSLTASVTGFPQQFAFGWGQRVMGLDRLPRELGGKGVRIAIIDSGCDNSHPLLSHIRQGRDFAGGADQDWNQDAVGHGTHCAGIISARPTSSMPFRGFAPDAEVHVLRIFPGGGYSTLLKALDYCIDQKIDIVNMSLGGDGVDPFLEETLEIATHNGITCIVAAGNSGDSVKYPAASRWTLGVAAIGSTSELKPDTWDTTTLQPGLVANDGTFSPNFTCHGPEVKLCAPGVAIISTVPGGAFQPESGTSMATPHVTGMAALLLAHHPVFQSQLRDRTAQRAQELARMLLSVASSYPFGADRTGSGVPRLNPLVDLLVQTLQPLAPHPQSPGIGGVAPMAMFGINQGPRVLNPVSPPSAVWVDPHTGALLISPSVWK
jgi:subtilisin family serine protease